ncbi:hypothetical protein [Planctomycetes bacterium TBK1r]|uniref:Acid-resistance membrane protein n=1 Tax=Stieleria magnilauensis TaxID=2527963 RepID=A0ABX5XZS5_9BACT|nr:hypothetical protein TBK1r_65740 [Planctomycetes bacterium TBK1r]
MTTPQEPLNPYAPTQATSDDSFDPLPAFGSPEAMSRVATGLSLVYWGIALIMISIIGTGVMVPLLMRGSGVATIGVLALMLGLGMMLGVFLGLVGRICCLTIPEESRARGLIYAAVAFDLAAIVGGALSYILVIPYWPQRLGNLLSLIATVLFVLFLKRVSAYIRRPDLEGDAKSLVVMGAVVFVLAIAVAVAVAFIGSIAGLAGVVVLVIMILMLLRYVRLLSNLRKAILGRL